MSEASDYGQAMAASMERMMQAMHAAASTSDPDTDFLAMMIPHHVGAIEMAKLVLTHGRDPATRQLAQDIIAGQTVEIESMQRRLAALRQRHEGVAPEYPALGGTRGP
jgi:uncharacterized protein (DUF305 family)